MIATKKDIIFKIMGNKNIQLNHHNNINTSLQLDMQRESAINYEQDPTATHRHSIALHQNKVQLSQEVRRQLKSLIQPHQYSLQNQKLSQKFQSQTLRAKNQELTTLASSKLYSTLDSKSFNDLVANKRTNSHQTEGAKFRKLSSGQKLSIQQQEDIGTNIIQHLIQKQKYSIAPNALQNQPKLGAMDRARFIDWAIKVLSGIQAQDQVLFRAVALSDRVIKIWRTPLDFKGYQLLALTCIQMAAKLQEHNLMNVEDAREYLGKKRFSKSEIILNELEVLRLLRFRTMTPTVYDFMMPLMSFIFEFLRQMKSELDKEHKKHAQKMGIFLSMLVLHEPEIMFNVVPSQIGGAIVFLTLNFMKKIKNTYLNDRKLDKILGYLEFLIGSSREAIMMLSLQIKKLYSQFDEKYPVAHTLIHSLCPDLRPQNMFSE